MPLVIPISVPCSSTKKKEKKKKKQCYALTVEPHEKNCETALGKGYGEMIEMILQSGVWSVSHVFQVGVDSRPTDTQR